MRKILKESDSFLPVQNIFTQVLNKHDTEEHAHEYYEIFYVLSGNATHYVNGARTEIKQNDLILLKPGQFHIFTFGGSENFCHRDLLVRKKFFEDVLASSPASFRELLNSRDYISAELTNEQIQYFEKETAAAAMQRGSDESDFMMRSLLFSIVSALLPQNATPPPDAKRKISSFLAEPVAHTDALPSPFQIFAAGTFAGTARFSV